MQVRLATLNGAASAYSNRDVIIVERLIETNLK
jgi:hypothetical protein